MGARVADNVTTAPTGRAPAPVRCVSWCVSPGRRDGLVRFTRPDDSPVGAALTGPAAARVKEAVAPGTVWSTRHPGPYRPGRAAQEPTVRTPF